MKTDIYFKFFTSGFTFRAKLSDAQMKDKLD
jgi:hypothetical protein